MRLLFVTDLHGSRWKYNRLLPAAQAFQAEVVVNGGDMLPKGGDPFAQDRFITGYLDAHFAQFDAAGIRYPCYLGNDGTDGITGMYVGGVVLEVCLSQ